MGKRKLSYAMAMVGDPKIVLMDEPSTGMGPQSKRFVWDCIQESFKDNRGAILTTHSMEEADAICSRIGIMVDGELKCLGSSQDLKNKFGGGYNLHIKWLHGSEEDWSHLVSRIEEMFPEAATGVAARIQTLDPSSEGSNLAQDSLHQPPDM